jgi:hypothetical protein
LTGDLELFGEQPENREAAQPLADGDPRGDAALLIEQEEDCRRAAHLLAQLIGAGLDRLGAFVLGEGRGERLLALDDVGRREHLGYVGAVGPGRDHDLHLAGALARVVGDDELVGQLLVGEEDATTEADQHHEGQRQSESASPAFLLLFLLLDRP